MMRNVHQRSRGFYGSPRVTGQLRLDGIAVGGRRQKAISCIRLLRRDGGNTLASRTGLAYSGLSPP